MNPLFSAVENETEPMFDAALITEGGTELWRSPVANNANNSHSVTKFFIATAIGILCDRKLLSIDTEVTGLFDSGTFPSDMSPLWHKVRVKDCLRHKTGMEKIPYGVDEDEHIAAIGDDFLKYVFSIGIDHEPGTFYKYSDAAYYLLGRVIAAVTGAPCDVFLKEEIFDPLGFRQWAMAKCPQRHPICGGGFFARGDDIAKLGYTYACCGVFDGRRIISEDWIAQAMENDYACTRFRDSDIFLKTGANGQCVAFSTKRRSAAAWHGFATDDGKRNDRLLSAYRRYLDEAFGEI